MEFTWYESGRGEKKCHLLGLGRLRVLGGLEEGGVGWRLAYGKGYDWEGCRGVGGEQHAGVKHHISTLSISHPCVSSSSMVLC